MDRNNWKVRVTYYFISHCGSSCHKEHPYEDKPHVEYIDLPENLHEDNIGEYGQVSSYYINLERESDHSNCYNGEFQVIDAHLVPKKSVFKKIDTMESRLEYIENKIRFLVNKMDRITY